MGNPKRGRGRGGSRGGERSEKPATLGRGGRSTARRARRWQGARPAAQQGISSVQAVFAQPELLERILDYSVHDQNIEKRLRTLGSVRLVNKTWLTGVTKVMRKNKEPLYKLTLTKDNSLSGTPFVEAQGKLLDQLVTSLESRIEQPSPTFRLKLLMEFFRRENHHSLVTFLRECGHGLVELEMIIPVNGGSLPGILPRVKVPLLKKLVVTFSSNRVDADLTGKELSFAHSANVISLIQGLLNSAQSLKKFVVPGFGPTSIAYPAPAGIEVIIFPESITTMDLTCQLTSQELELLTASRLPNLERLVIPLRNTVYTDGILSKILANFSEKLRILFLKGSIYRGPPRHSHLVHFPIMKQLTHLTTSSNIFELEDPRPLLNQCFPKLSVLRLYHLTPEMFQKWVSNGPLSFVRELSLGLIDENRSATSSLYKLPINLESMQRVHLTFPNLRMLTLELSSGETESCGLKYLFMEMRQLTYLKIKVYGSESIVNSDFWDSVFTGAPISMIAALRENRDYWTGLNLKEEVPSLRMLSELQSLSLEAFARGDLQPLLSDFSFTFALLKMPKLVNLRMYGRFSATDEMMKMWEKKTDCKLKYSLLPPS